MEAKIFTNFKRIDKDGDHPIDEFRRDVDINRERGLAENTITENLIIKGNNLLVLDSLLKEFRGKVKLIYIDPPYNTGSDEFQYNDNFKHSTWLTFMKNRLEVARKLLKEDGAIFISINHIELGYLLVLMDEIFGRENKLPIITLRSGTTASYRSINECPVNVTEYVIGYRKSNKYKGNPIYVESDYSEDYSHFITNIESNPQDWVLISLDKYIYEKEGCKNWQEFKKKYGPAWKKIRFDMKRKIAFEHPNKVVSLNTLQKPSEKIKEVINLSKKERDKVFVIQRENNSPIYCYNGRTLAFFADKFKEIGGEKTPAEILTNLWLDVSFLGIGPEGNVDLPNGKKPELLIKYLIEIATLKNNIILDFYLGTGTTCAVAHKMGRQYIGIEQLDYGQNSAFARIKNVINGDQTGISRQVNWKGSGEFVYMELMKLNETFISKIQDAKTTEELLNIWEEMKHNGFLSYRVDPKLFDENIEKFKAISLAEQKNLLVEMLDYNDLYVNYSEMDDAVYNVSEQDKRLNRKFYRGKENE